MRNIESVPVESVLKLPENKVVAPVPAVTQRHALFTVHYDKLCQIDSIINDKLETSRRDITEHIAKNATKEMRIPANQSTEDIFGLIQGQKKIRKHGSSGAVCNSTMLTPSLGKADDIFGEESQIEITPKNSKKKTKKISSAIVEENLADILAYEVPVMPHESVKKRKDRSQDDLGNIEVNPKKSKKLCFEILDNTVVNEGIGKKKKRRKTPAIEEDLSAILGDGIESSIDEHIPEKSKKRTRDVE